MRCLLFPSVQVHHVHLLFSCFINAQWKKEARGIWLDKPRKFGFFFFFVVVVCLFVVVVVFCFLCGFFLLVFCCCCCCFCFVFLLLFFFVFFVFQVTGVTQPEREGFDPRISCF